MRLKTTGQKIEHADAKFQFRSAYTNQDVAAKYLEKHSNFELQFNTLVQSDVKFEVAN